jgi:hypothetical protein
MARVSARKAYNENHVNLPSAGCVSEKNYIGFDRGKIRGEGVYVRLLK